MGLLDRSRWMAKFLYIHHCDDCIRNSDAEREKKTGIKGDISFSLPFSLHFAAARRHVDEDNERAKRGMTNKTKMSALFSPSSPRRRNKRTNSFAFFFSSPSFLFFTVLFFTRAIRFLRSTFSFSSYILCHHYTVLRRAPFVCGEFWLEPCCRLQLERRKLF